MSEHPPTDLAYEAQLKARLLQLLRIGPKTLENLVICSEGAYPTDVLAILRKLHQAGTIKEMPNGTWSFRDSTNCHVATQVRVEPPLRQSQPEFPEPHPLDFDWRFDTGTLESLYWQIQELKPTSVAVLGAPTLFKFLVDRGQGAHLFDRNTQIVQFLEHLGYQAITQCDLLHYSPRSQFQCVVADPPWYLDYYWAFVAASRKLLTSEGKLLLSILPRLTRPSAEADRKAILTLTSQHGFDLIRTESGVLRYASPPFEGEALKAEGLDLPIWRVGDLWTYVRTTREVMVTDAPHPEDNQVWRTFNVGRMIVKVKWDGTHKVGAFSFQKVSGAAGMRLRSVSRRSPSRSEINLWTSRNLALKITRPDLVCQGLQLLLEGHGIAEVRTALMAAEKLTQLEVDDLNDLFSILIDEARS